MHAYVGIKYHADNSNRDLIERLTVALEQAGVDTSVMARDHERWGNVSFSPSELMGLTFKLIDESDAVIIDLSEKGVGLGIEAGYGYARGKPVYVVAREGSDISDTLAGITKDVFLYRQPEELRDYFSR